MSNLENEGKEDGLQLLNSPLQTTIERDSNGCEVFLDKGLLKVTKGKTKTSIRQVHLTKKAMAVLRLRLQKFKGENLFPQNDEDFRPATQTIDKMHINGAR